MQMQAKKGCKKGRARLKIMEMCVSLQINRNNNGSSVSCRSQLNVLGEESPGNAEHHIS